MAWCVECAKDFDDALRVCPDCGALLESDDWDAPSPEDAAECSGDCASCAAGCDSCSEGHASCEQGLWPTDDEGKPVKPVRLTTVMGNQMDYELTVNLLQAYGVPTVRDYPNAGELAKLIFGFTGAGMDIYVPETFYEEAKALLEAEPEDEQP